MYGKVFVVIVIITIFCDISVARPLDCRDGEVYWCESKHTARKCKKEEYCKRILTNAIDDVVDTPLSTPIQMPQDWDIPPDWALYMDLGHHPAIMRGR